MKSLSIIAIVFTILLPIGSNAQPRIEWQLDMLRRQLGLRLEPVGASSIALAPDGSCYFGGTYVYQPEWPNEVDERWWVSCINSDYDTLLWQHSYGSPSYYCSPTDVLLLGDEIALVGRRWLQRNAPSMRSVILYLGHDGDSLDFVELGNAGVKFTRMIKTTDGGLLILANYGNRSHSLYKVGVDHQVIWSQELDFDQYHGPELGGLLELSNGEILLTGSYFIRPVVQPRIGYNSAYALWLDSDGNIIDDLFMADSMIIQNHFGHDEVVHAAMSIYGAIELSNGDLNMMMNHFYQGEPDDGELLWILRLNQDREVLDSLHIRRPMLTDGGGIDRIYEVSPELFLLIGEVTSTNFPVHGPYLALMDSSGEILADTILSVEGFNEYWDPFKDIVEVEPGHYVSCDNNFNLMTIRIEGWNEVEDRAVLPPSSLMLYSYPSPFNSVANIRYDLPEAGDVRLGIYDMSGREVAALVQGVQSAGRYQVAWKAGQIPTGLYLCRLEANGVHQTRRLMLLK